MTFLSKDVCDIHISIEIEARERERSSEGFHKSLCLIRHKLIERGLQGGQVVQDRATLIEEDIRCQGAQDRVVLFVGDESQATTIVEIDLVKLSVHSRL